MSGLPYQVSTVTLGPGRLSPFKVPWPLFRTLYTPILALSLILAAAPVIGAEVTPIVARVNDHEITLAEYADAWNQKIRQTYYHGQVPEDEIISLRKQTSRELIERHLILQAAKDRGIKPDQASIGQQIQSYNERYRNSPQWQEDKDDLIPVIMNELGNQSMITQIRALITDIGTPSTEETRTYYEGNPDKFTMPPQSDLSFILIRVTPTATQSEWNAARQTAESILNRHAAGETFPALAAEFSEHESAANGGQLGTLHIGMLAEEAQNAVDNLETGEVTQPLALLEGVGLFKLNSRQPEQLLPFGTVKARAEKLLTREREEQAWSTFVESLREQADITLFEDQYIPSTP